MFGKRFSRALVVTTTASLVMAAAAFADNTVADGDGPSSGANALAFGNVGCDVEATESALIAISRNGGPTATNTFANNATVTVSVLSVTGDGLSASIPAAANTITLPSNWTTIGNNVLSASVTASVKLTSATEGGGSGDVTFRATGLNTSGATIRRDDTMNVTWTTGTCTGPDTTAPSVSITLAPASPDGNNSWYVSDVGVTVIATDDSGIASTEYSLDGTTWLPYTAPFTISADGNHAVRARATDASANANEGSDGPVDFKIDQTDPTVSLVGGPVDGASYSFGSVPAAPTCSASDATSGLAGSCSVSGYGTTVGSHTVKASATDMAGNTNSDEATYTVLAWSISGFYRPVDMGVLNSAKAGSTIPLKFEVFAGTTELTDTAIVKTFTQKIACDTTGGVDAIEEFATGNTSLRYDSTGGQFIFNWKTPSTKGCYRVTLETQDGTKIFADFQLK